MRLKNRTQELLRQLRSKGAGHWMIVALLIPSGMLAGDSLGRWDELERARFGIYQLLQKITPHEPTHTRRTAIVLMGDEEYWRGELARRVPLKRDYLARLLYKLDLANPAVIALDVDLRAQTPDRRPADHPDYRTETQALLTAVREVSRRRPIVLSQPILEAPKRPGGHAVRYEREPTLFDGIDFRPGRVTPGYVSLPYDLRRVPLALPLTDGARVLSFAAAVVDHLDPKALADARAHDEDGLPYGTYMPPASFPQLSAARVLRSSPESLKPVLEHQAVLVSGAWHTRSFGRGPVIDSRRTPAGRMSGVFVHGNYVEALYLDRTKAPLSKGLAIAIEIALSLSIAVFFSLDLGLDKNLALTFALGTLLAVFTLFAWQNLGLFFDFFVPAVLLLAHAGIEQVRELKEKADHYDQEHAPRKARAA